MSPLDVSQITCFQATQSIVYPHCPPILMGLFGCNCAIQVFEITAETHTEENQGKGTLVASTAACKEANPPPSSRAIATNPSIKHQKTRWGNGASDFPPAAMMSITREPESDEVMKKRSVRSIATEDKSTLIGSLSNILKSAISSFPTATLSVTPVYPSTMC